MTNSFPMRFTLENGTHVVVNNTGSNAYEFILQPEDGPNHQFTYVDDGRTKTQVEESLAFEEIDALRQFWLETEDIG